MKDVKQNSPDHSDPDDAGDTGAPKKARQNPAADAQPVRPQFPGAGGAIDSAGPGKQPAKAPSAPYEGGKEQPSPLREGAGAAKQARQNKSGDTKPVQPSHGPPGSLKEKGKPEEPAKIGKSSRNGEEAKQSS